MGKKHVFHIPVRMGYEWLCFYMQFYMPIRPQEAFLPNLFGEAKHFLSKFLPKPYLYIPLIHWPMDDKELNLGVLFYIPSQLTQQTLM